MSAAFSMPMHWDSYLTDTMHLTLEEHGAYLLLLGAMWKGGGFIDNNDRDIARVLRVAHSRWMKIKPRLMPMIEVDGEVLTQKKLKKVWKNVQEKIAKNKQNGALGGRPKLNENNNETKPNAKPNGYDSLNPTLNQLKLKTNDSLRKDIPSEYPKESDAFETFWQAYPVKKSKPLAERSWVKAVKAHGAETIMDGLDRAKRCDHRFASGFTPHPSTWLNANGFLDDHTGVKINGTASHGPKRGTDAHLRALYEAGMDDANGQHRPF